MADDAVLRRVLAAERAIVHRGVDDAREIPGGWVVRHPPLPDIWHLNRVHLTGSLDAITPDELVALADRWLGDAGHRRVTLDDVDAADALWPALEQRGWRRERAVVMVLGDPATRRTDDPRVSRLSEAELAALQPRAFADDAMVTAISETLPARLGAAQSALRAGTEAIGFGAAPAPGDPLAASVTLYFDPDVEGRRVALVDQVATLRSHREQGLATAAMAAAIGAAGRWRADTIALFADADDWPQVMYAAMGFATVGRQVAMHRDV